MNCIAIHTSTGLIWQMRNNENMSAILAILNSILVDHLFLHDGIQLYFK